MNQIIIRKPKFMRNDSLMKTYLELSELFCKAACVPGITLDQKYDLMDAVGKGLEMAAKNGGFLNVGDMIKWLSTHSNN